MKVSIVIPVYNVAPWVGTCLDSIQSALRAWLSGNRVEIVCVDDGSTDGSAEIIDGYAQSVGPAVDLVLIRQKNAGVSVARNRGIEAATGDWLFFVDADDVLLPGGLDRLLEIAARDEYDAFFTGHPQYFCETAPAAASGSWRVLEALPARQTGKRLLLTGKLWGWPCIRLLRRSLFQSVRFPEGIANLEDSISLIDVLAVEARWCWIDCSIYGYRSRSGSACRELTPEKVKSIITSFGLMYEAACAKLHLAHHEAMVLMRQYASHMSIYIASVIPAATVGELCEIAALYDESSRRMRYRMANAFVGLALYLAKRLGTKRGSGWLLRGHRLYVRVQEGIRRRLPIRRRSA